MITIQNLYERYKNDVFYYLLSITRDSQLSEDLTSETFLAAIKSIYSYRGEADIKTWLFSIARYKWYGYLRKQTGTKNIELDYNELAEIYMDEHYNLEEQVIHKELIKKAMQLIEQESKSIQQVVKMRIEGYSYHEIAEQCKISESSARVINYRMKQKLKQFLAKEEKE